MYKLEETGGTPPQGDQPSGGNTPEGQPSKGQEDKK